MKKLNNKSGFTLIEIIVVMIIIGVLAAIALPNLFTQVGSSRGAATLQTASSLESPMETCLMKNSGITPGAAGVCDFNNIAPNLATSGAELTAAGTYVVLLEGGAGTYAGNNNLTYSLVGFDAAALTNEVFDLQRNTAGTFVCSPGTYSIFLNVC